MGGAVSTRPVDPNEYLATLAPDEENRRARATRGWNVFSEDLEWAALKLQAKDRALSVGRRQDADVLVANKTTSGVHAELTFDEDSKLWKITDMGSSSGTTVLRGGELIELSTNTPHSLSICCAVRLGKAIVTLVSDQVSSKALIECTSGPLRGKYWEVPNGTGILTCGTAAACDIKLDQLEKLEESEFQIFRYNGWFALSDSSKRENYFTTDNGKSRRNVNGIYLNGKKIKPRAMNFLWMGAKITIVREREEGKNDTDILGTFVVKCKFK